VGRRCVGRQPTIGAALMRVLVTGSTSMLGASVARMLAERGDQVTLLQRSPSGSGLREVLADISDADAVSAAVANHHAVVHCAARVGVVGSAADFERTNVTGTRVLTESMVRRGVERLVHVSSPSVAHSGSALVGVDAQPANPATARGHYSRTKAAAELLALASGVPAVVVIRPHLVWGPGDTQLVGRIVDRGRAGRMALIGNGTALIDTTYIDNAADALVHALDRAPQLRGECLVVSNGEPRTVAELIERILRAAGISTRLRSVPASAARGAGAAAETVWSATSRDDDPPMTRFLAEQLSTAHWFDQRRTRELLHWRPQVTLAEGFERLAQWYAERA